jgi:hypothetical protein
MPGLERQEGERVAAEEGHARQEGQEAQSARPESARPQRNGRQPDSERSGKRSSSLRTGARSYRKGAQPGAKVAERPRQRAGPQQHPTEPERHGAGPRWEPPRALRRRARPGGEPARKLRERARPYRERARTRYESAWALRQRPWPRRRAARSGQEVGGRSRSGGTFRYLQRPAQQPVDACQPAGHRRLGAASRYQWLSCVPHDLRDRPGRGGRGQVSRGLEDRLPAGPHPSSAGPSPCSAVEVTARVLLALLFSRVMRRRRWGLTGQAAEVTGQRCRPAHFRLGHLPAPLSIPPA